MKKIRNFGTIQYHGKSKEIRYSYFEKQNDKWIKKRDKKYLQNEVFIPNSEAVVQCRKGTPAGLRKDLFGNPILRGVVTDFYDKCPPEPVRQSKVKYDSDISPSVKFLAKNFEFDPEQDEIPNFRIQYMDIETLVDDDGFLEAWDVGLERQGDRGGVTLISSYDNISGITHVFGREPYNDTQHPLNDNVVYLNCQNEYGILREYMKYLKKTDPDIITGWNCYNYDIPYIINRLMYCFGPNALYHFGQGTAWINNDRRKIIVNGINIIDYMVLYKKFELKPRRSYSLDNITQVEGIVIDGEGKIKHKGSFRDFYENNCNKFVRYCIQDSRLVERLDEKKKLLDTFIMCCYMAGISFTEAIGHDISWLRIHDAAIYRFCHERGLALPEKKEAPDEVEKFTGAYVYTPKPSVYDYVTVYDVASLYPSCIRALNISIEAYRGQVQSGSIVDNEGPFVVEFFDSLWLSLQEYENHLIQNYNNYHAQKVKEDDGRPKVYSFETRDQLLQYLKGLNYCIAANGAIFTKDFRGVIPSILDMLIADRKKYKKVYFEYKQKAQSEKDSKKKKKYNSLSDRYNTIQSVKKIFCNSLYGYIGTKYSRFYNTQLAEAVTSTGRFVLQSTADKLDKRLKDHYGKV